MAASTQTFTSARSIELLDQIAMALVELGRATAKQLGERMQLSPGQISIYTRELERRGLAHFLPDTTTAHRGHVARIWFAGPAEGKPAPTDPDRRVVVRTTWEPNHVRGTMECYLFGALPALARAA